MTEKSEIKRDGAKATKNSGRGQYIKADSILDGLLTIDYKEYGKSFSISRDVWAKLCMDNLRNRTIAGVLKVVLGGGSEKTRVWVVGDSLFQEMYNAWKETLDD